MQVAGSVAVAVVITDPSLAVSLSWADLISVGLLSYLLHSTLKMNGWLVQLPFGMFYFQGLLQFQGG